MIERRWRVAVAVVLVVLSAMVWAGAFGTRPGAFVQPRTWPQLQSALAGLAWGLAGVLLWGRSGSRRLGTLMVAVAAAIITARWIDSDLALLSTIGLATQWVAFPLQLWTVLGYPEGRLGQLPDRVVVGALLGAAFLHGVVAGTMYEPVLHWSWCDACEPGMNLLLIRPVPDFVDAVYLVLLASLGLAGAYGTAVTAHRWVTASRPARRVRSPILLPAVAYLAIVALYHLYELAGELGVLTLTLPLQQLGLIGWFAMLLLPVTFVAGLARARARRGRVADLVTELEPGSSMDRLEQALRRTLGDPTLELVRLQPGEPLPAAEDGQATTIVDGDDGPLAALVHDVALLEDVRLLRSTTAATRLAIENARLAEQLEAQLVEVRASRSRIVEAGDEARRQVERDLHDGAQQRLVSLSLLLRQARTRRDGTVPELDEAVDQLDEALRELRDLARGVYPAALLEGGLSAALDLLAERAPLPTIVTSVPAGRLPEVVEAAAYFVVNEAVANAAKHADASLVQVTVTLEDGLVVVEVADDGRGGAHAEPGGGLRGLHDRVEALEGRLTILSAAGQGTTVRAELPCASS